MYKNLLQETAHRAGLNLPVYTTVRSGPGHLPVFTCAVELAGMTFTGEPAKTKKQAEKNAAMAAWSSLKQCNGPFSSPHIKKIIFLHRPFILIQLINNIYLLQLYHFDFAVKKYVTFSKSLSLSFC